ncbi:MAG TPA: TonB family protein [Firmicutes bacterium]|nr:TonB family protein [Bacillota bacterium]
MANTEVKKLREKYKDKMGKSKKNKSFGGILTLLVIVIVIGAIWGYFKFMYEAPESKELRMQIWKLEEVFREEVTRWEENAIASNELMKIHEGIEELYLFSSTKINPKDITDIRRKYNTVKVEFENVQLDLPKTKVVPEELDALREELEIYIQETKKPSKEEKEALDKASNLLAEATKKLEDSKTIEDLNAVFEDLQEIKSHLTIFTTKLQIKEREWVEEKSRYDGNVIDFEKTATTLKNWIECFSKINKLWEELKKEMETSKLFTAKTFNLKNLADFKKANDAVDKRFDEIFKTVEKFAKTGEKIDLPCEAAKTAIAETTGPKPKPIVVAPELISDTFKPGFVSKSILDGSAQVIFEVVIDEQGNISDPKITQSSGNPEVDKAAEQHIYSYKFVPGKDEDGKPGKCLSPGIPVMIIGQ